MRKGAEQGQHKNRWKSEKKRENNEDSRKQKKSFQKDIAIF